MAGKLISNEDLKKIVDLKRIYGQKGLGDLLNVNQSAIDLALSNAEMEARLASRVRSGVRFYWRAWMGECGQRSPEKAATPGKNEAVSTHLDAPSGGG